MGVAVAKSSAAALSKVSISNGHCIVSAELNSRKSIALHSSCLSQCPSRKDSLWLRTELIWDQLCYCWYICEHCCMVSTCIQRESNQ